MPHLVESVENVDISVNNMFKKKLQRQLHWTPLFRDVRGVVSPALSSLHEEKRRGFSTCLTMYYRPIKTSVSEMKWYNAHGFSEISVIKQTNN